jgi:hypothetical protein
MILRLRLMSRMMVAVPMKVAKQLKAGRANNPVPLEKTTRPLSGPFLCPSILGFNKKCPQFRAFCEFSVFQFGLSKAHA